MTDKPTMTAHEAAQVDSINKALSDLTSLVAEVPRRYEELMDDFHQKLGRIVERIAVLPPLPERSQAISKIREAIADLVSTPIAP